MSRRRGPASRSSALAERCPNTSPPQTAVCARRLPPAPVGGARGRTRQIRLWRETGPSPPSGRPSCRRAGHPTDTELRAREERHAGQRRHDVRTRLTDPVYCKQTSRPRDEESVKLDFLGYTCQPSTVAVATAALLVSEHLPAVHLALPVRRATARRAARSRLPTHPSHADTKGVFAGRSPRPQPPGRGVVCLRDGDHR